MDRTTLTRATVALRIALHTLFVGLVGFVAVDAIARSLDGAPLIVALAVVMLGSYAVGAYRITAATPPWIFALGSMLLAAEWIALFLLSPAATYIAFPLFFLLLHLLGMRWGTAAVAVATLLVVVLYGWHNAYSIGAVIGPIVGAAVAVVFVWGYRTLQREATHREELIDELIATRGELARQEHEAGALAERSRLAREIHDTVAQGLSSIQMLLHAAERADPDGAGLEHVRLARDTAATNLAETRRFIEARSPAALQGRSLANALRRLASDDGLSVDVAVVGDPWELPMPIETALLRVAQESITNVRRHAHATRAAVTLTYMGDTVTLDVVDDGDGFDTEQIARDGARPFGIAGMRTRVEELGGSFTVESPPGSGVAVAVTFGGPS